jgi:hypothetical protein
MNIKRVFGAQLTILGIGGLIFTAVLFVNSNSTNNVGVLGLIFFILGIGLVRTTKDEA